MINFYRKILFILLIIQISNIQAQKDTITLVKKGDIINLSFPCESINDCIDSCYRHNDTLYILLQDTRKFYQDSRRGIFMVDEHGYFSNNPKINVFIQKELVSNFIVLRTFDYICVFQKRKRNKRYKLISIEEKKDYCNKKILDLKDSKTIIRR